MSTPTHTPRKSGTPTPARTPADDNHQGNEELAAFLMSPKGISCVVAIFIIIFVTSIVIFNYFGQRATSIWAVVVTLFLFAVRHFIGNAKTKIHTQ